MSDDVTQWSWQERALGAEAENTRLRAVVDAVRRGAAAGSLVDVWTALRRLDVSPTIGAEGLHPPGWHRTVVLPDETPNTGDSPDPDARS